MCPGLLHVYRTLPAQFPLQQTWSLRPNKLSSLYSKMANPAIRWHPRCMSTILQLEDYSPNSTAPSPGSVNQAYCSPHARHLFARKVTSGVADNAPQLKRLLDLNVMTQAIRNMLKRDRLKSSVKKKKPFLSSTHGKAHLEFALEHQHWTLDDWARVIWSDETKVNRLGSDGRLWVWKWFGLALTE